MNENKITTTDWSNKESQSLYQSGWPNEPELNRKYHEDCEQCGECSFYAIFNSDFGLCCHEKSRHHLETVFEHFTCAAYCGENWKAHSFTENVDHHCRCG